MIPLEEKIGIWRGMPTETAEETLWADNYYREELMPLALKRFARRYENETFPEYYGMILLLGSRWEDLAFNVGLLSPQNIHVICRKEDMPAYRHLVDNLQLEEERCLCTTIPEDGVSALYHVIKKQHDIWDSMGKSAVDITGGDVFTLPAAAMAAAVFDMDVYRLSFESEAKSRKHKPGSERMIRIESVQPFWNL